jgi:DNA-directed RNA polymerase subunit RPC12/RpoP
MATATQAQQAGSTVITLSGTIDENDDFSKLIGQPQGKVHIKCKGVTRINSMGVKNWIKFFSALGTKATLEFSELTTPLVENSNMIQNFVPRGSVQSVMVPYRCTACSTNLVAEMKTAAIIQAEFNPPAVNCPKCAASAEFDDMPDEFFAFLKG